MTNATDPDGLTRTPRSGFAARAVVGLAILALIGVAGFLALRPGDAGPAEDDETPQVAAAQPASAPQPPRKEPQRDPMERAVADALAKAVDAGFAEGDAGMPKEIWVTDLPPGDGTGLHAFNKPGTKPLKAGLLVPDGFALPPGYVRHVQTTDDGRELPAILMFHPDYAPVGPDGKPIALPKDRIVPPELAPPGMPLQHFDPPAIREDLEKR